MIRVSLFFTSLSIVTICAIALCLVLIIHYKNTFFIQTPITKNLWIFVLLFSTSFLPLLWHAPLHSYGVFIEWIFIPALTSFLLSHHFARTGYRRLHQSILYIFSFMVIWALLLLWSGILTYDGRLGTSLLSPNQLALFIAPLFFIVASIAYTTQNILKRSAIIFLLCNGLVVLFYTYSFSAFFAVSCVTALLIIILCTNRIAVITTLVILCIIGSLFIYQKTIHSDYIFARNSFSSRLMIWDFSIYHIQQFPLIGNTIDDFQNSYLRAQPYFIPYLEWDVPTPHNLFLTLWISGGFVTLYTFLLLCVYVLYGGLTHYAHTHNINLLFFCAALLTIILCGIVDTSYWKNDLAVVFWIIIALISAHLLPSPHTENK